MSKISKAKQLILLIVAALFFCAAFPARAYAYEDLAEVDAKAALVVVGDSDKLVYEKNINEKMAPASLTKMMTALLVFRAIDDGKLSLDTELTASHSAIADIPWDASRLDNPISEGEVMTVKNYLYAIMLRSDAFACNIVAEAVSGSISAFVEEMNAEAERLGCTNTHFADTSGYAGLSDNHYSCAWDLYLIARAAMEYDEFAEIVSQASYTIPATNKTLERPITNSNWLLDMTYVNKRYGVGVYKDMIYSKCIGIKTGMTDEAGNCLAAAAEDGGLRVYTIILGAQDIKNADETNTRQSFAETIRMDEWAFANFVPVTAFKENIILGSMTLGEGKNAITVNVGADKTITSAVEKEYASSEIKYKLEQTVSEAVLEKGDEIGEVSAFVNDELIGKTKLVCLDSSKALLETKAEENKFRMPPGAIAVIVIIVAAFVTIKLYIAHVRRKKLAARRARRKRMLEEQRKGSSRR